MTGLETMPSTTHNIGFYEDLIKIIFQLSSNMHLISSSLSIKTEIIGTHLKQFL